MFIAGIVLAILGAGSLIFGVTQNNDVVTQFSSLMKTGYTNPGTVWIIIGALAIVVGIVLMIVAKRKPAQS